MTAESQRDDNAIANSPEICASPKSPSNRRAMLLRAARRARDPRQSAPTGTTPNAPERPSQRLRRVLTTNPRARYFSVQRIILALGETPQGPALALFSAAGVFEAPDVGHLSGVMTGALGVQYVLRRRTVKLPRALLKRKIPRSSLATLIDAVANLLERAEAVVKPRWGWVFHPGMGVVLGVLLFLLGVASMTPFFGLTVNHAASAFLMSIGLAERDGFVVLAGAVAAIASLAATVANVISGRQIWVTAKIWLVQCLRRHLRVHIAAWFLDRIAKGLGDLLRIEWSNVLLIFFSDFAGRVEEPAMVGARVDRSLKARAQRIRLAESQRVYDGEGAK